LSFDKRLRGKTSRQSWRRVVLGAIRTNCIAASMFIVTTARAASRKRIQGAPFMQEFSWHLLCNTNSGAPPMHKTKSISTNKIRTYSHNHPSQNESTDRMHVRNDFLLIQYTQITTPPQNKNQKIQIGLSTAISATLRYPRVKLLQGFQLAILFFLRHSKTVTDTVYQLTVYTYSLLIDCMALIKRRVSPL